MAKFLTGNELNSELEKLFERADEQLILISPYIKLHDRFTYALRLKKDNPKIKIVIVFGKNEEDFSKSMKYEDFVFFKDFPNIEIRYERRLHAKYYASESSAILTSMNLYDFSQDSNIEAGVMTKATLLGSITNNLMGEDSFDKTALAYFSRVIEQSDLLFKRTPEFEATMFGLSKKFIESKTDLDTLTDFFSNKKEQDSRTKKEQFERKSIQTISPKIIRTEETKIIPAIESKPTILITEISEKQNAPIALKTELKFLSTTALSKEVGQEVRDVFVKLEKMKWIERSNESWLLTETGRSKGGRIKKGQHGEYIAWPETLKSEV